MIINIIKSFWGQNIEAKIAHAIEQEDLSTLRTLLTPKFDIKEGLRQSFNALDYAIHTQNKEIVAYVAPFYKDVFKDYNCPSTTQPYGTAGFQIGECTALEKALLTHNLDIIDVLLTLGCHPNGKTKNNERVMFNFLAHEYDEQYNEDLNLNEFKERLELLKKHRGNDTSSGTRGASALLHNILSENYQHYQRNSDLKQAPLFLLGYELTDKDHKNAVSYMEEMYEHSSMEPGNISLAGFRSYLSLVESTDILKYVQQEVKYSEFFQTLTSEGLEPSMVAEIDARIIELEKKYLENNLGLPHQAETELERKSVLKI